MSLFYFFPPDKDWGKSEGFTVGHSQSKSHHQKLRESHTKPTHCFLQPITAFRFPLLLCWVHVVHTTVMLGIRGIYTAGFGSWFPPSFRAVTLFKLCRLIPVHLSLNLSFKLHDFWRTWSCFWYLLLKESWANPYTSYLHS